MSGGVAVHLWSLPARFLFSMTSSPFVLYDLIAGQRERRVLPEVRRAMCLRLFWLLPWAVFRPPPRTAARPQLH